MTGEGRRCATVIALVLGIAVAEATGASALAQGVGFLTEQQRLVSYCTGVSEARMRELNDFIKVDCAGSNRKECVRASDQLGRAQVMDRRLWAYLTTEIFASKDQGPRERALAYSAMTKGGNDWVACKQRPAGIEPEAVSACRESRGCLIQERFTFLPP